MGRRTKTAPQGHEAAPAAAAAAAEDHDSEDVPQVSPPLEAPAAAAAPDAGSYDKTSPALTAAAAVAAAVEPLVEAAKARVEPLVDGATRTVEATRERVAGAYDAAKGTVETAVSRVHDATDAAKARVEPFVGAAKAHVDPVVHATLRSAQAAAKEPKIASIGFAVAVFVTVAVFWIRVLVEIGRLLAVVPPISKAIQRVRLIRETSEVASFEARTSGAAKRAVAFVTGKSKFASDVVVLVRSVMTQIADGVFA